MALKRVQLDDALCPIVDDDFEEGRKREFYAWNREAQKHFRIDSIALKHKRTINVPLEREKLVEFANKSYSCIVTAENILRPKCSSLKENLSKSIDKAFTEKFGPEFNKMRVSIDLVVKCLIVSQPSWKFTPLPNKLHPGAFGTMLLQLPVGTEPTVSAEVQCSNWSSWSGAENISYQGKPPYYLTFLVGDGSDVINVYVKSFTGSPIAFLVFDLLWPDSYRLFRNPHPNAFLGMLWNLELATEALIGWESFSVDMLPSLEGQLFMDSRKSSDFEPSTEISLLDAQKTPALCIPAMHSYYSYEFHMDNLKDEDVRVVNLLKLVDFIDVGIAIVKIDRGHIKFEKGNDEETTSNKTRPISSDRNETEDDVIILDNSKDGFDEDDTVEGGSNKGSSYEEGSDEDGSDEEGSDEEGFDEEGSDEEGFDDSWDDGNNSDSFIDWMKEATGTEEKTFSVDRWVQGDWTYPTLHENLASLRFDCHLVGDVELNLGYSPSHEDAHRSEDLPRKRPKLEKDSPDKVTYHPAIIIRPLKLAIYHCWKHCPVRAVQCLTQRLNRAVDGKCNKESLEPHVIVRDVQFILDLIIKEHNQLTKCQKTAILHQLLYVCSRVEAIDEGLKVLEMIPEKQCDCREVHREGFEGFFGDRNLTIEDAVMSLVSCAGWQKCWQLVCRMYSRCEIDDYSPLHYMSNELNKHGAIEGAMTLAKRYITILTEQEDCEHLHELNCNHIYYFIGLSLAVGKKKRKGMYFLLRKLALKSSDVLHAMIRYYFLDVVNREDNLVDLNSTISGLILQVDYYPEDIISPVICFPFRTQNAELAARLWSKFFSSGDDQQGPFERMLSDGEAWYDFKYHEDLYKAIAASPIATLRFYKFIEDRKMIWDKSTLRICFYHITMAEREPNLADEQKLQSYLSAFKKMDVKTLTRAAKVIVFHNERSSANRPISQTIISFLLECVPTNDLPNLLLQDTADFGGVMYCYFKLGTNSSQLRLVQIFKETLLNGNFEERNSIGIEPATFLMDSWLSCLFMKLDDEDTNQRIISFQILKFFRVSSIVERIRFGPVSVDRQVENMFRHISQQPMLEMLEKILIGLYEREYQGTPECLKTKSALWMIGGALSDVFASLPLMKTAILEYEPERIAQLMCSIMWLGSSIASRKFACLLKSLPFPKLRRCLSMFVLSGDGRRNCAINSAYAFTAVQDVFRHCLQQLFADVGSVSSWARQDTPTVDCAEVKEFYQSEEKSKTFGPFGSRREAERFLDSATKHLPWVEGFSTKHENKTFFCEIVKVYPVDFDAVFSCVNPAFADTFYTSYDCFVGENCLRVALSKMKCTICLTPSLSAL